MSIPILAVDLIDALDREFPEKSPDPNDSERKIWMYVGKRELVRNLVAQKKYLEESQFKE